MNPEQLLQELRGLHEPPEPSWWPPAPGIWLACLLLLVLSVTTFLLARWYLRRTACKRAAQKLFTNICTEFAELQDKQQLARRIAELFKRVLLLQQGRRSAAMLTQDALISALEVNKKIFELSPPVSHLLKTQVYQKNAEFDAQEIIAGTRLWIKQL